MSSGDYYKKRWTIIILLVVSYLISCRRLLAPLSAIIFITNLLPQAISYVTNTAYGLRELS